MIELLLYPLIAGLILASVAGPLGSFVVWQRLAYFGDTLAHSALLGVAIGLWFDIESLWASLVFCSLLAGLLVWLQRQPGLSSDTLLGLMSHGSLALGLVAVSLSDSTRLDLNSYLFGDLLAVGQDELLLLSAIAMALAILLWRFWDQLISITVQPELAEVEGLPVQRLRLLLMLMIASLVAIAMQLIGILLITALLIVPAATARRLASSPEQMAVGAAILACLAICAGMSLSIVADTPTGASIVTSSIAIFCVSAIWTRSVKTK